VATITYYTVSGLARKIESQLSESEIKQLIRELVKNHPAEFQERTDTVALGRYAPVTKVCIACNRPL
jgi:hypothetical protein